MAKATVKIPYIGPIRERIPMEFHKFVSEDTLNAYLTDSFDHGEIMMAEKNVPVIVREKNNEIYPQVLAHLNSLGKRAVAEIHPWVLLMLIDMEELDKIICDPQTDANKLPDQDVAGSSSVKTSSITQAECEPNSRLAPAAISNPGKWTIAADVKYLLELFCENNNRFNNPTCKKKTVWSDISSAMIAAGFQYDADKCERKLLNLKAAYKKTKVHNNQSGNDPKTCTYFEELDAVFRKDPSIIPLSTCSTIKTSKTTQIQNCTAGAIKATSTETVIETQKNDPSSSHALATQDSEQSECSTPKSCSDPEAKEPRKEKMRKTDKIVHILQSHLVKQEKMEEDRMKFLQEMKKEQMEQNDRFISVLEKMCG